MSGHGSVCRRRNKNKEKNREKGVKKVAYDMSWGRSTHEKSRREQKWNWQHL